MSEIPSYNTGIYRRRKPHQIAIIPQSCKAKKIRNLSLGNCTSTQLLSRFRTSVVAKSVPPKCFTSCCFNGLRIRESSASRKSRLVVSRVIIRDILRRSNQESSITSKKNTRKPLLSRWRDIKEFRVFLLPVALTDSIISGRFYCFLVLPGYAGLSRPRRKYFSGLFVQRHLGRAMAPSV